MTAVLSFWDADGTGLHRLPVQKGAALSGKTMGTSYHIKVVAGLFTSGADLQRQIDNRLAAINQSMSTYDPASEISRFQCVQFSGSNPFRHPMIFSTCCRWPPRFTNSPMEPGTGPWIPLINLWGFGRKGAVNRIPDENEINRPWPMWDSIGSVWTRRVPSPRRIPP
jgi:thiamine biosynthesis lipoprotein